MADVLLVVAAALRDAEGRVLMQRRPEGKAHAGLWEFPGGKLEPGETPEAALVRELAEELGIVVDPGDVTSVGFASGMTGTRPIVLLLYACVRWHGSPRAIEGGAAVWFAPDGLAGLAMPPLDVPLARQISWVSPDKSRNG